MTDGTPYPPQPGRRPGPGEPGPPGVPGWPFSTPPDVPRPVPEPPVRVWADPHTDWRTSPA